MQPEPYRSYTNLTRVRLPHLLSVQVALTNLPSTVQLVPLAHVAQLNLVRCALEHAQHQHMLAPCRQHVWATTRGWLTTSVFSVSSRRYC